MKECHMYGSHIASYPDHQCTGTKLIYGCDQDVWVYVYEQLCMSVCVYVVCVNVYV